MLTIWYILTRNKVNWFIDDNWKRQRNGFRFLRSLSLSESVSIFVFRLVEEVIRKAAGCMQTRANRWCWWEKWTQTVKRSLQLAVHHLSAHLINLKCICMSSQTPMFSVLLLNFNYRFQTMHVCARHYLPLFLYFSCFGFSEHRYALWCNCISNKFHILNASIPLFISNEFTHLFVESLIHSRCSLYFMLCFDRMFVRLSVSICYWFVWWILNMLAPIRIASKNGMCTTERCQSS